MNELDEKKKQFEDLISLRIHQLLVDDIDFEAPEHPLEHEGLQAHSAETAQYLIDNKGRIDEIFWEIKKHHKAAYRKINLIKENIENGAYPDIESIDKAYQEAMEYYDAYSDAAGKAEEKYTGIAEECVD